MFVQESGLAEQEKKNKRKPPTNVYPIVQQITITYTQICRANFNIKS